MKYICRNYIIVRINYSTSAILNFNQVKFLVLINLLLNNYKLLFILDEVKGKGKIKGKSPRLKAWAELIGNNSIGINTVYNASVIVFSEQQLPFLIIPMTT